MTYVQRESGGHQHRIAVYNQRGEHVADCDGPASDGSCPSVAVGNVVPCAGKCVCNASDAQKRGLYDVPRTMTLCPVCLAQSLAAGPAAPLF